MSVDQIKVLVAEDNHISQQLMKLILAKFISVEPVIVSNGAEAYEHVRSGNFDVVFMDNQMPACNGPESVQLIRQDSSIKHQPVIIGLSASCKDERSSYMKSGLDAYIEKPVSPAKLESVLRSFSFEAETLRIAC